MVLPHLHSLRMETDLTEINPDLTRLPWAQITELSICTTFDASLVLRCCTNLTILDLELHLSFGTNTRPLISSPLQFESLSTFKLRCSWSGAWPGSSPDPHEGWGHFPATIEEVHFLGRLIEQLTLPQLHSFKVETWANLGHMDPQNIPWNILWPDNVMTDFLNRSHCNITTLYLDTLIRDEDLISYLWKLPSVTDLTVDDHYLPPDTSGPTPGLAVIHCLAQQHPAASGLPFLPNLKRLSLAIHKEFNESAFVDMIFYRCGLDINRVNTSAATATHHTIATLQSVDVLLITSDGREERRIDLTKLDALILRKKGVSVTVSSFDYRYSCTGDTWMLFDSILS